MHLSWFMYLVAYSIIHAQHSEGTWGPKQLQTGQLQPNKLDRHGPCDGQQPLGSTTIQPCRILALGHPYTMHTAVAYGMHP